MAKTLITGITGFLGSHIAESLVRSGTHVIGLKRSNSDTWRCKDFEDKVEWLDFDNLNSWKNEMTLNSSITVIHCAWIGVESKDRDNWLIQSSNIDLLVKLLDLHNYVKIEKFIFLGSQAEYGLVNGKVDENYDVSPVNAYGGIKLACLDILKAYSTQHNIKWLWLRVFSVFGARENDNWLIPSVIKSMRESISLDFTSGEQKYAYLYVNDFSRIIGDLIKKDVRSGVYNVSSNQVRQLKSLIELIRDLVNPAYKLNFGAIPYRENQSMHIEGDITKLIAEIGQFEFTEFNVALSNTIKHYIYN